jgi:hypothetical protein
MAHSPEKKTTLSPPKNRVRINSGPDPSDVVVPMGPAGRARSTGMPSIEEKEDSALPLCGHETAFSHLPEHGISLFLARRTKTVHFGESLLVLER